VAYAEVADETGVVLHDLESFVIGAFGDESPKPDDLGSSPPKRAQMSEETVRAVWTRPPVRASARRPERW
jgi:hypothetical protein